MVIRLLEQSPSHAVRVTAPFTQGGLWCNATGENILDKSRASPVDCCYRWLDRAKPSGASKREAAIRQPLFKLLLFLFEDQTAEQQNVHYQQEDGHDTHDQQHGPILADDAHADGRESCGAPVFNKCKTKKK